MQTVATVQQVKQTEKITVLDMARGITRFLRSLDYYPHVNFVDSPPLAEVECDGQKFANFFSNSFLGLCNHPKILEASRRALERYGTGTGSARIVATQSIHRELEEKIATFKRREDAVIFSAGMLANWGVLPALASSPLHRLVGELGGGDDLFGSVSVFIDHFSHSCIFDGAALSMRNLWGGHARVRIYRHMDMEDLREKLGGDDSKQRIIATDGVFSIHGHVAPLREIVAIAKEFNASVYVDDAHGTGVLGPTGRGSAEMLGVDPEIDIPVGTFSKALGGAGGFVVGDKEFCDYLRIACRTYVFQTAMPPAVAGGLIAALDVVENEPWRREQLLVNSAKVRGELECLGFSTLGSKHHIVPVLIGDEMVATKVADDLKQAGILVGCIRYPAVPLGEAALRCNMMATHTEEHLGCLVTRLKTLGRKYRIA